MPIPDYQSLMLPVLDLASKGETSVPLAEVEIAARFGLSDQEREQMLPSGKQRLLHNRIHWAKFYLTKAGLLESPKRSRFVITATGQKILADPPPKLDTQYLLTMPAFQEFYRRDEDAAVLIEWGLIERTVDRKICVPFDIIHADFDLQAAA